MKIGLIGFGNHAQKLINIISSLNRKVEYKLYNHRENYSKDIEFFKNVHTLEELFDCDAVFITSPNDTHFGYLKILIEKYSGYVFCEKPPVTNRDDLKYLEDVSEKDKKRIYFNFNYRFSPYFESLKNDSKKYSLGNLVTAQILQGHGLALKECYKTNWRSDKNLHKTGVIENYSIHYFDMFVTLFDFPEKYSNFTSSKSPFGDSIDNSSLSCQFKNGATLNITVSYTTPKVNKISFIFENGIIEFDTTKRIYGPREVFDEKGLFDLPPLIVEEELSSSLHDETLNSSIKYFLSIIDNSGEFEIKQFNSSLQTNRLLFL